MKALSLIGYKKSGKTTLGIALCKELTARGLKVAIAKCSESGFDEAEGADTARYKTVANGVIGFSEKECFVSWPEQRTMQQMLPLVDADVLLVEGGKTMGFLPRVILAGEGDDLDGLGVELALATYGTAKLAGKPTLSSVSEVADLLLEKGFLLPGLSCGACGRKGCRRLAMEIVAGEATLEECPTLNAGMLITINGAEVAVNPFVERILTSGLRGMLGELKGYVPGGKIRIELEG
ncbi:MAG: molybdopterin-guanine dinucleotide biosynthesis protein MobB [Desulfovibrionaceae bacterium]